MVDLQAAKSILKSTAVEVGGSQPYCLGVPEILLFRELCLGLNKAVGIKGESGGGRQEKTSMVGFGFQ